MVRIVLVGMLAAALFGCGGAPAAEPPTAAPAITADQAISTLKTQLAADEVIVREISLDSGALPTLTINFESNITKLPAAGKQTPADLSAEIERSILIISKRVAAQLGAGLAVDRVNLVLKLGDQVVGNTRIGARDMQAWAQGKMTDGAYRASWAQTVNTP